MGREQSAKNHIQINTFLASNFMSEQSLLSQHSLDVCVIF